MRTPIISSSGAVVNFKTRANFLRCVFIAAVCLFTGAPLGLAEAWNTFRHDLRRSGISTEILSQELNLQWTYVPRHRPKPAWAIPGEETPRMHSDRAMHVVSDGAAVYFASSIDHQVYALDVESGKTLWTFYSEGPIRFAPVISGDHIFFASDDGYAYCINKASGAMVWRYRAGPDGEHVIGNGRMISMWPVRTGLLVENEIVYLAAGVFPYEGLYIAALDARTGEEVWINDTAGDLSWGLDYGGMAPQGYLLASDSVLYVPSGRAMPAAFDRGTGEFIRFLSAGGKAGGTWALIDDGQLIAGVNNQGDFTKVAYDEQTGARKGDIFATFDGIDLVQTPETSFILTEEGIYSINRKTYQETAAELPKLAKERRDLSNQTRTASRAVQTLRAKITELKETQDPGAQEKLAEVQREQAESLKTLNELGEKISNIGIREKEFERSHLRWEYERKRLATLALANNTVVVGGTNVVFGLDVEAGTVLWQHPVEGEILGLAISNGRVFAASDRGPIYCYGGDRNLTPPRRVQDFDDSYYTAGKAREHYERAAETILSHTKTRKGFCLVINSGEGRLAYEIAKRSEFQIVALENDSQKLETSRRRLDATGLYGKRIIVEPWGIHDLPDYFANLIVSDAMTQLGQLTGSADELYRVLRPFGGVAIFGYPKNSPVTTEFDVNEWLVNTEVPEPEHITENGAWWKTVRGDLEGAGSWTGLYGNNSNTGSSEDELVRGALGVLWYGEPGSRYMPDRHARSVSPLALNGRLFVQGTEVVMGYDGYNGTQLWERHIPGAIRVRVDVDGSNLTALDDHLFVAVYDEALQLDGQTGETVRTFAVPDFPDAQAHRWGYIAVDSERLLGSAATPLAHEFGYVWNTLVESGKWKNENEIPEELKRTLAALKQTYPTPDRKALDYFRRSRLEWGAMATFPGWAPDHAPSPTDDTIMVSDSVFAYDLNSGQMSWQHIGKRIPNITISIGDGKIFFVEDESDTSLRAQAMNHRAALIQEGRYDPHEEENLTSDQRDIRRLVALDVKTGKVIWSKSVDFTGCGGNKLGTSYQDGKLLCFGHYSNHDESVFVKGGLNWRRISVFDGDTGDIVWSKPLNYRRRPLIVGDTIYIEPRACDLSTGAIKMRKHPATGLAEPWEFLRPGHSCGIVTASPYSIFYRSYCAAFVDVEKDSGLTLFGAVRPGCWNNLIPANGVLNFQESSAGCTCSYALRSTVILKNKRKKEPGEWSVFISKGSMTPVSHLALNFGAPGEMRDDNGTLWFAYPRPSTKVGQGAFRNYGLKFDLQEKVLPGMGFFQRDFRGVTYDNTQESWKCTSGVRGIRECSIPVLDGDEPGTFRVRLGFVAEEGEEEGQRVFNIRLQGRVVVGEFDPVKEAGGDNRVIVKEFKNLEIVKELKLELVPVRDDPSEREAPILHFMEIIREDQPIKSASATSPL